MNVLITYSPKAMVPVHGLKPFICLQVESLKKAGFRHFILPRTYQVHSYFGGGSNLDIRVEYVAALGSAGMVKLASKDRLLVVDGSALLDCEYDKMLEKHVEEQVWATVARAGYTHIGAYIFDRPCLTFIPKGQLWDIEKNLLPDIYHGGIDLHFWTAKTKSEIGLLASYV